MPPDHSLPAQACSRFAFYGRVIRRGYRLANTATYHLLGALLKLTVLAYFIFCAIFLTLRYSVMPDIDQYKAKVEERASRQIGRRVTINTIYASWKGLRPYLFLGGVVIHDQDGREALRLPGVAATFSWWSIPAADVRLHSLVISRPDLDIHRDSKGKLFVAGIFIDTKKTSDGKGLDWILTQREIVIREGRIRYDDDQRMAPLLTLEGVDFVMRNQWQHHKFALTASPPASFSESLDVRADFTHPFFTPKISDVGQWTGELYADLRNTDLAAWKPYVDYPVDVKSGHGAVRAWLDFDQAKIADFTADLTLSHVSTRLQDDLPPLNLTSVTGRVSLREQFDPNEMDGKATFGANGHTISLTDFSMLTDDGFLLPATTLSETHVAAKNGHPEKTEIKARLLDLQTAANFVERLPVPAAQRQMLAEFAPKGRIKDFAANWQGTYPNISSYNVKGKFVDLSLKAQPPRLARAATATTPAVAAVPGIPGFENLTGSVDANVRGGSFNLESQKVTFDLPGYFLAPVIFDQLKMQTTWTFQGKDKVLFEVGSMNFMREGLAGSLSGRHLISLAAEPGSNAFGTIDVTGHIAVVDVRQIGQYLPQRTPEHLHAWLVGGLEGGGLRDVDIRIKGDLADFPFNPDGPGKLPKGEFRVSGKIDKGRLNYLPGVLSKDGQKPFWPILEDIDGTIVFDRSRLEVRGHTAKTHNVDLSNVTAIVPDLASKDIILSIDGTAAGPLQEFVGYTNDSPVSGWINHFTEETKAGGDARLSLKLELPLHRIIESKVQGTLQFAGNDVTLQNAMPAFSSTQGKLDFDEHGFTLGNVRAAFLGGPISITGGTQRDRNIMIKADGSMTAAGLRKAYAAPTMQRLADRFNGGARYSALISVKNKRPEITVESNMQGLGIDFPMPLRKAANESLPLKFELKALPSDDPSLSRDEIRLSLGSAISARYLRQKTAEKEPGWQVVSGGIGVNVPAPQPDSGLLANVNLKSLSIDAWSQTVAGIIGNDKKKAAVEGVPADALSISQYIEPEILAARATELVVVGKKLSNVVVGASHQKDVWQANIDSEQASGYVTWNETPVGQGLGKVTARLASLTIPKSAASDVTDLLEGKSTSNQMPALDIVSENFELTGKKLGRLEVLADNVVVPAGREWRINKLSLVNPDAELRAIGKWTSKEGESMSSLSYRLEIGNAGKLLDRFGFANVLRGGKGRMDGEISWNGLPFAFDIPSLSGQIKFDLASGQFLKVESGGAKLLSVLSLQGLPRRLALDFRDVFSEGFAFDGINGTANIVQGVAKTNNLKMRSVNATVLLDGSVDIAKESQDLHAVLIPEVNAGAASIVYALAVNPVIGVGTFLAQLFLREPLAKAFTSEYKITGPWKEPVYTKLERKVDKSQKGPEPTLAPAPAPSAENAQKAS